jgi:hypothetical protein
MVLEGCRFLSASLLFAPLADELRSLISLAASELSKSSLPLLLKMTSLPESSLSRSAPLAGDGERAAAQGRGEEPAVFKDHSRCRAASTSADSPRPEAPID